MAWLGCAHAAGKYPDRTAAADFYTYGCTTMKGVGAGFRTLKTYLTSNYATVYPGQNWGSVPTNLTQLAQTAPVAANLGDPAVDRHVLTAYTFANGIFSPIVAVTPTQIANEYTEIYNLVVHLLSTYSGKHFILQNTEGDWELLRGTDPNVFVAPQYARNYAAFVRARQNAVTAARAATPSTSTVELAVECNRVLDDNHIGIVTAVLPLVEVDVVQYTTYEATTLGLLPNQAQIEALIDSRLTQVVTRIRRAAPRSKVVFSEFAWPQDEPSFIGLGLNLGQLIQRVIDTANNLSVDGAIWWQIFDNEEMAPGVPRGFSLYDRNGNATTPGALNDAGVKFASIL